MFAPPRWHWFAFGLALLAAGHHSAPATREIARIQEHLLGAERILLARDLSGLSAAQRDARARRIAELQAYRRGGVFPHNHSVSDRRTPVFVDGHGTRCAMAHLIERSGAAALVARIAHTRNLAWIRDLAGDPELVAWLESNGLTVAEAARIQPAYSQLPPSPSADDSQSAQWAAAGVGAAVGATGIALNRSVAMAQRDRNTRGLTGVGLGLLAVVLSIPALAGEGDLRTVGFVDLVLGATSVGMGVRNIETRVPDEALGAATSITPVAWRDGDGTRRLALMVRF